MLSPQTENLERVSQRIGPHVEEFCKQRIERGATVFFADELREYIQSAAGGAPDSASRILRDLRSKGRINYRVISRADSLYEVVDVAA